jgi:hypothetical protein
MSVVMHTVQPTADRSGLISPHLNGMKEFKHLSFASSRAESAGSLPRKNRIAQVAAA